MERKEFIKTSCTLCVVLGAGTLLASLASCASLPIYKADVQDNKVAVPLSLFATQNLQIVRPRGSEFDVALHKEADGTYTALLLSCTHADNALTSTGNGYVCNLHGSTFDAAGKVTKGPAERSLKSFTTSVINDNVIIKLT
jgi:Rieske Fe-S protein